MDPLVSTKYYYDNTDCGCAHVYILPEIERLLTSLKISSKRAFDLGCGNGAVSNWLHQRGFDVSGVDPSETGIELAKKTYPNLDLQIGSAYDALHEKFGRFPLLVSLEVIEHVYAPRDYARTVYELLEPNGYALISTPYHGYLKNLALAVTGKMESHFSALWDHGHIKFWSRETITILLSEAGLEVKEILRIGRIPVLAKSMLVIAQKRQK